MGNNKFIMSTIYDKTVGFYFEDGKIDAIKCYDNSSMIGNIYVGRVSNVAKNINAAFVDIAKNYSCYLSLEDCTENIRIGDVLIVQVIKDGIKTKKPTVTTNISINSDNIIIQKNNVIGVSNKITSSQQRNELKDIFKEVLLNKYPDNADKYGCIIRTAAANIETYSFKAIISDLLDRFDRMLETAVNIKPYSCIYNADCQYLTDIRSYIDKEVEVITDIEDIYEEGTNNSLNIKLYDDEMISLKSFYGLETIISKALKKNVYMKSGAYLVIEPTEAMTVIDVNSGKSIKGSNNQEALFKINQEAVYEIAKQLRIRNISGIVIVDFINLKDETMNLLLLQELKKAVANDYIPVQVVDITRLGLVEMTRKKVNKPIYQIFLDKIDSE